MAKVRKPYPYLNQKTRPISLKEFKSRISYDPTTGIFKWAARVGSQGRVSRRAGKVAGCVNKLVGYVFLGVRGRIGLGHMWAWFYITGKWPRHEIDHRNRVRHDNRWKNLRKATRVQNCHNATIRSDNTSGFKGVGLHKQTGKWRARITAKRKTTNLGLFDTANEAAAAYVLEANRLHGMFATHANKADARL